MTILCIDNNDCNPALTVTVSGQVNETALRVEGFTAPDAFVIVTDENNAAVGTTTAAADGSYSVDIHALAGDSTHTVNVFASNGGQTTPTTSFVVMLPAHTLTTVSGVLLPTFIDVNPLVQNEGDPITVSGQTVPGGEVTVFVEPPLQSVPGIFADGNGDWSVDIINELGALAAGSYQAYAQVSHNSILSELSRLVSFSVSQSETTTKLELNGFGPPGAFLTFRDVDSGEVVGTGTVDGTGVFSKLINFPDANATVTVEIIADNGSQLTPPTSVSANLTAGNTTEVNDILLPTFIAVSPASANEGDPITVSGVGAPNSDIELTVNSPTQVTTTTTDATGNWSVELISTFGVFSEGAYSARAKTFKTVGLNELESIDSREVAFQVIEVETATDLVVEGFGAPDSFIIFTENNDVVGTTVVDTDGTFSQVLKFPDVNATRTISLIADDGTQSTPPTTFTANLTAFSTTVVSNIALPTFINVNPLKAPFGSTVTALGKTYPGATVRLFVQQPLVSTDITVGSNGQWSGDLNALFGQLQKGTYTAYARVLVPGGHQSILSREVTFEVVDADQCAERRSDLNCDGRVDITDVGILIFYWGAAGNGHKSDINKDGVVDISDVGIMVFDWTF